MAKITRKLLKLFGESGSSDYFGKFGSAAAGSAVKTKDIDTIQSLSAWLTGLSAAVNASNRAPFMEDFNSLFYVLAYEQAYALQEGIPEYDSGTYYYIGSIVKKTGTLELYASRVDDNVGNALPSQVTDANWLYLGDLGYLNSVQAENFIINGGMQVDQRGGSRNLVKDSYLRSVDMFAGMVTGTAVSAGTLVQDASSAIASNGCALKFAGVTATGTGILYLRYRMEAQEARRLKNKTASFQVRVIHDVGSAVNYTVYFRKANAADTFSAVTAIDDSGAVSVASATDTVVKFEEVALGDCSNGLEIEVKVECGAVTSKNFSFAECQLEVGPRCSRFGSPSYQFELERCQRSFLNVDSCSGEASNSPTNSTVLFFYPPTPMRTAPAASLSGTVALINANGAGSANVATASVSSRSTGRHIVIDCTTSGGTGLVAWGACYINYPTGSIYLSCEL